MSIKIYDFLGNLQHKVRVELDEIDLEAVNVLDLLKNHPVLPELVNGFKYYASKSGVWVRVKPGTELENVFMLKEDFEFMRHGLLLKIILDKALNLRLAADDTIRFNLDRKTLTVEDLLAKLVEFERFKAEMKGLSVEERSVRMKRLLGMSVQSVLYYKSLVRKGKKMGFDFQEGFKQPVKQLVWFVRRGKGEDKTC